jgi:hypothetical protein
MKTSLFLSALGLLASTAAFAQQGATYAQAVGGTSGPSVSRSDLGYQPAPAGQVARHRTVAPSHATKHVPSAGNQ